MKLPVTLISRARRWPIASASSTVSPHPGMMPTRACVSAKRARSEATRKSHVSATSKPPVTAAPLTAPITGLAVSGNGRISSSSLRTMWRTSESVVSAFRSTPAQNAGSAPVSTMASTSSRASHAAIVSGSAAVSAGLSALRDSGSVEGDDRHPVRHVHQDHVLAHASPLLALPRWLAPCGPGYRLRGRSLACAGAVTSLITVPSIAARASRRTQPCLRGCRRWPPIASMAPTVASHPSSSRSATVRSNARKLARAPTGPTAQMRSASASAPATAPPGSVTTFTNPSAYARSGESRSPVSSISLATLSGNARGVRNNPPHVGTRPRFTSGSPNDAVLPPPRDRRRARSRTRRRAPAPRPRRSAASRGGAGSPRTRRPGRCGRCRRVSSRDRCPAENTVAVPVMTPTQRSGSSSSRSRAAPMPSAIAWSMALRFSSR